MYERVQAGENTYYIDCPSKIGICGFGEGECFLVDSGNDASAAKKALQAVEELGWKLRFVINTHYHADHTGGSALLQNRTGCKIYMEDPVAFLTHPELNAALLYGGKPPEFLKGKFFLARGCKVEDISAATLPEGVQWLSLPGHAMRMIAVRSADKVWFLGDSLTGKRTLEKYGVTYLYDVRQSLESVEKVRNLEGNLFVPAHPRAVEDVRELCEINRESILQIAERIWELLAQPKPLDQLLREVFLSYGMEMNLSQQALIGATVRSYLTYLEGEGRIVPEIVENCLVWKQNR
ncbi:MAG TPA: MBL fold metallo-hydrolase [Candidatus Pullichristensenella excrementigallinarum]|uniref:beta-lactamase n=1 Tax=Candidatus Pullichristensenella excrementigallinarum TaxID=2840907 RepID=A0A9D1IDE2_9FIRM|nr:MBL fold metallo-hydrolase [Candidatus Pullichristensenella excrementigallinarum]